ncbi:flagellar hook-length control protein FliK [Acerihabitans sp. KWT182]|uniref:Flagellar hook-length control protein FliK n=1 Tax=Acerihabitans sp. KWT182 TaxID=3157919 RepID=A0AAU7Q6J4_9GAMM
MITLPSEITSTSGAATAGATASTADTGDQGFSALFNSKVAERQQQQSADNDTATSTDGNGAATQTAVDASVQRQVDSKQQRADKNDDSGGDAPASTTTLTGAEAKDRKAAKTTAGAAAQKDADPALDTDAAQTLMALLAQTNPAALPAAGALTAGQALTAGANDVSSLAGTAAGLLTADAATNGSALSATPGQTLADGTGATDASMGALRNEADNQAVNAANSAANSVANSVANSALNGTQTSAATAAENTAARQQSAAKATVPAAVTAAVKKSATVMNLESLDANAPSAAADNQGQPASTDGAAAQATVTPALSGQSEPLQSFSGSNDTVITLKKTGDIQTDSGSSQPVATPTVTPTLSAAGANTSTPTPASALISAQLGSDEWQQAIGQQVVMYSRDGQQNAELRLHPDSLGTVQISMQVDTNNVMQIHLASGHSQVRSALEDALPQLRDSLAQSGISLGQSSVGSDATPNWGGNGQNASGGDARGSGEIFSINATAAPADNTTIQTPSSATGRTAGVDTFV